MPGVVFQYIPDHFFASTSSKLPSAMVKPSRKQPAPVRILMGVKIAAYNGQRG